MTINLIDSILANRTNTRTTPIDCYGTEAKARWTAFRDALYDWSCTESAGDCDKAFAAGKVILAAINAELPDGKRVKFAGNDDLLRYRDAAIRFANKDTERVAKLKAIKSFAKYRAGLADSFSCTKAQYDSACRIVDYKPEPKDAEVFAFPAELAKGLIDYIDDKLASLKDDKEAKQKEKAVVGVEAFRKSCEVLIADAINGVMSKTTEQLSAERKAHNAEKNAVRKVVKAGK